MSVQMNSIIFVNEESLVILSSKYPENSQRKYIVLPILQFFTSKYNWSYEGSEVHNQDLYKISNEKPFFMSYAQSLNHYNTDFFTWVDIGCFRHPDFLSRFFNFPTINQKNTITFLQIEDFTEDDMKNLYSVDERFRYKNCIGGTMFACHKDLILPFAQKYKSLLTEFDEKKLFKGKDQSLYAFCVLQNPSMFSLVKPPANYDYDSRFYLHDYLSENNKLTIVLIGPGIMPIPPTGWGAVEILVWDYAKSLEKLGHRVTIVNTPNMDEAAETIKQLQPDIVHIQYDDHAWLCEKIHSYVKLIAITTHYGYLEQSDRWGSYANTFYKMIQQTQYSNVYHFTLSERISNVYRKFGIPNNRLVVTPNGANTNIFQYHKEPAYANKSICLGKIEDRKRQAHLQSIPDIYFAGNIADHRFHNQAQYLGEWSKETLYNNLSHFGNMVLLSDGEADPLVVKEALVCGLGVVISYWASANLDISKEYIDIIPDDKIGDLQYVSSIIKKNRDYSMNHRDEIRQYGLTFSWDLLVTKYLENINNIFQTRLQN